MDLPSSYLPSSFKLELLSSKIFLVKSLIISFRENEKIFSIKFLNSESWLVEEVVYSIMEVLIAFWYLKKFLSVKLMLSGLRMKMKKTSPLGEIFSSSVLQESQQHFFFPQEKMKMEGNNILKHQPVSSFELVASILTSSLCLPPVTECYRGNNFADLYPPWLYHHHHVYVNKNHHNKYQVL